MGVVGGALTSRQGQEVSQKRSVWRESRGEPGAAVGLLRCLSVSQRDRCGGDGCLVVACRQRCQVMGGLSQHLAGGKVGRRRDMYSVLASTVANPLSGSTVRHDG